MIAHKIIPAQNKIRHYSWSTRAWVNFFIECAEHSINAGEMPSGCKNSVLHHFITVGEST